MPKLNLKPNYLRLLLDVLEAHAPEAEVWAYGSRVNGDGHDGSVPEVSISRKKSFTCFATSWTKVIFRCS